MPMLPEMQSLVLRPVAAALVASLGLAPCHALATQFVTNCNDAGVGSLRAALLAAGEGELVDATALACSKITLTTGLLIAAQNAVKVDGPGADKLTIEGANDPSDPSPVLFHNGNGTLEIDHVTISHGNKYLNSDTMHVGGGCISTFGNLVLTQSVVSDCTMTTGLLSRARGGAIYANGYVTLTQSLVTGSSAHGATSYGFELPTYGGAIFAKGSIRLDRSTLSDNHALIGGAIYSAFNTGVYSSTISGNDADQGGAIDCRCALQISDSTIANNHARTAGAIELQLSNTAAPNPMFIRNSTITGNTSDGLFFSAALDLEVPITISNSTIAFNIAPDNTATGAVYSIADTLTLQSTIIAENYPADVDVGFDTTVLGTNNLSPASRATMPQGTLTNCPLLGSLAWNGGPTQTLALRHTSLAIGAGNNLLLLSTDQRGTGFPRAFGGVADIGAWEWQGSSVDDSVFHSGFEPGQCHG